MIARADETCSADYEDAHDRLSLRLGLQFFKIAFKQFEVLAEHTVPGRDDD